MESSANYPSSWRAGGAYWGQEHANIHYLVPKVDEWTNGLGRLKYIPGVEPDRYVLYSQSYNIKERIGGNNDR
jgi:hypothetical protein